MNPPKLVRCITLRIERQLVTEFQVLEWLRCRVEPDRFTDRLVVIKPLLGALFGEITLNDHLFQRVPIVRCIVLRGREFVVRHDNHLS